MISAYIMPHPPIAVNKVGRGEERKIQATLDAFEASAEMIRQYAPETIIIISPHNTMFRDAFYLEKSPLWEDDLSQFYAPDAALSLENDTELCDEIAKLASEEGIPVEYSDRFSGRHDHGSLVPLLFVTEKYKDFKIVRIAPSLLENNILEKMGHILERAAAHLGRKTVLIASGDLSHKLLAEGPYGFTPEGPEFDTRATEIMKSGNLRGFCGIDMDFADRAAQCGLPGFVMLGGALNDYRITPHFMSHEGPFGVGYAICAFECRDRYVELAETSINNYVKTGKTMSVPDDLPENMTSERAGVFVSIHCGKNGEDLRGCIGTINACYRNVAEEVVNLAVSACSADPRFPAVREDELPGLVINVDVLSDAHECTFEDLDPARFGVIVSNGFRRGLLLPDLDGVDTSAKQVSIALRKAGIRPDEDFMIERFTVERHT